MLPTLNEMGDVVLVDKLSPRFSSLRPIRRGDIVIADSSYRRDFTVCKRVIALEGDTVHMPGHRASVQVPQGHVWLEGDNPHNSVDSRSYGPVPAALIRGRVSARIWPFPSVQWLGWPGEVPARPTANYTYLDVLVDDRVVLQDVQARIVAEGHRAAEATALAAILRDLQEGIPTLPSTVVEGGANASTQEDGPLLQGQAPVHGSMKPVDASHAPQQEVREEEAGRGPALGARAPAQVLIQGRNEQQSRMQ